MELTNEQKVMQQVINEAWENESFKQELLLNPLKAIEKLTGQQVRLPEGKTLVVRDQTDQKTIFVNIPAEHHLESAELSDEQMEHVAGGGALKDFIHIMPTFKCWPVPATPSFDGYKKIV